MVRESPFTTGLLTAALMTGPFLSGAMMCISMLAIPVFFDTTTESAQLLHSWVRSYHYGHRLLPSMSVATSLLYGYVAISKHAAGLRWRVFALASMTTMMMLPFTWIIMVPTNNTLFQLEAESKTGPAAGLEEAQGLVIKWRWMHVMRSLFPLIGAVFGFTGTSLQSV